MSYKYPNFATSREKQANSSECSTLNSYISTYRYPVHKWNSSFERGEKTLSNDYVQSIIHQIFISLSALENRNFSCFRGFLLYLMQYNFLLT